MFFSFFSSRLKAARSSGRSFTWMPTSRRLFSTTSPILAYEASQ